MKIPVSLDQGPVIDMVYNLKVRDAMTAPVICAQRDTTLREIRQMMSTRGIAGVPVADGKRLLGLITTEDIIQALDGGWIEDPAESRMTREIKMLEDDMPLSYAITFFDKYTHGRFPVVNRQRELVGILTGRDILSTLLLKINGVITALEAQLAPKETETLGHLHKEFLIIRNDFENAGKASSEIKKLLKSHGIDQKLVRRIAIATYELEMNITVHSFGGRLMMQIDDDSVSITAQDRGPGIDSIDNAMTEGFSTANEWIRSLGFGAGMGLPNIKRVSDEFSISSDPGQGTRVVSTIHLKPAKEQV